MIKDAKPINISILDKEYRIACPEAEQEALLSSAKYLDSKMTEVRNTGKVIGIDRIAVMAALNIVHELIQQKEKADFSRSLGPRLRTLQSKVEKVLANSKQMAL